MKDYLLAALLITTSPDVPETRVPSKAEWVILQPSITDLAVRWQLLDQRETAYILTTPEDYPGDLIIIRRRYRELKDVPLVEDGERFPEREQVNRLIRFNRSFRTKIADRMGLELDRQAIFTTVIRETDQLYAVWDAVRDARCEFYYVTVRRQALKKLQALLGEDDYRTATLPPLVPTWRFNDLR